MKSDAELLRAYVGDTDEAAFTTLVQRHLDLVYSAALRQVNGDAHLARDVAQLVFTDLARKASTLLGRTTLAGWLYTSTHYAAANAVRAERRRRAHEQESHVIRELTHDSSSTIDWDRLRPVLDRAMLELNDADREAVVQRFFSGRSFAEIGATLHLSEDTARKRVERALDKLHALLGRRGIHSTSAALALALSTHAVAAAPVGLAATIGASVLASTALPSATAIASQLLLMSKLPAIAGVMLAILSATLIVQRLQVSAAQSDLAALHDERARVTADLASVRQRLAGATAPGITAPAPISSSAIEVSATTERWGSPQQLRANLDASYAPLFRRLKLGPARTETLKDLLAARRRIALFEMNDFLAAEKPAIGEISPAGRRELEAIATREIDARLRVFLGPADFEYFQTFERTRPYRTALASVVEQLRYSAETLHDEQVDQLVGWIDAEFRDAPAPIENASFLSENVMRQAETTLSPLQFEKLRLYRSGMEALGRQLAIHRAAEANGLIKPVSHLPHR